MNARIDMAAVRGLFSRLAARGAPGLPIGVDFAAESLNMMQVDAVPGGARVRAAVSLPYPIERSRLLADPRALRAFVRGALAAAPFSGRRMVGALAPSEVRILPLTVNVPAGQNEQQAVGRAVREQLGAAAAESVVDYYQVRSADAAGSEKQVLAAVAPTATVVNYLEALRGAGLDPVALDIGPAAIARLLAAMHREDYGQSVLLINFGSTRSYLTVIWGRRLMLDREIELGETTLVSKVATTLGLDARTALALLRQHGTGAVAGHEPGSATPDMGRTIREILHSEFAALAEELVRTQVYVASRTRGSTVSKVYLNGSVARYANIPQRIAQLVHLPVEVLDPFTAFADMDKDRGAQQMHGIALAAGLALRGVEHG
ncbi:pilus assembly protein PilM [Massilia sp. IC2-477]|uniref:pilus assembly protein PilM n=1 Tax=Massilia sp. IC2-477 TaxID=2887198 RepID=UPI001D115E3E|nr:pilus assembly protein PilM [Massilia sp. IC2-477]MCC2954875.1 pilus assembly protein PilM [Massilia sp. IC2-477]